MAIEKGKVIGKLLVKYKGTSLTKNFLENLGAKFAAKLPDDADDNAIDEYINDRDDLVQESIKETDKRVTEAVNKAKGGKVDKTDEPAPQPELPTDAPDWAKTMIGGLVGQIKTLGDTVTKMQTEKTQQTLQQRFEGDPRLKGINPKLLKGRVPTTEDEFETAINEAVEDLKEFVQDDNASGGGNLLGGGNKGGFGKDKPNFAGKNAAGGAGQPTAAQKTAIDNVKKFTDGLKTEVKETNV